MFVRRKAAISGVQRGRVAVGWPSRHVRQRSSEKCIFLCSSGKSLTAIDDKPNGEVQLRSALPRGKSIQTKVGRLRYYVETFYAAARRASGGLPEGKQTYTIDFFARSPQADSSVAFPLPVLLWLRVCRRHHRLEGTRASSTKACARYFNGGTPASRGSGSLALTRG